MIQFATDIGLPLDPWQAEALTRGLELRADGRLRFRIVLLLVARQNGKTTLLAVLSLYWLAVELHDVQSPDIPAVLGTSNKLEHAADAWKLAVRTARKSALLSPLIPPRGVRQANGQQTLTIEDAEYRVAAANDDAGRSLTVYFGVLDELRDHATYAAWDAVEPATSAVDGAMIWGLSNAGYDSSIVLNQLRTDALAAVDDPDTDLAILEWSAPDGADPEDVTALAAANPNLGHRKKLAPLLAAARRVKTTGGDALAGFRTEHMCQRVRRKNPALDIDRWIELGPTADEPAVPLDGELRKRTALAWDLSPDGMHATLYAAALDAGIVRLDVVAAWSGPDASKQLRSALPALTRRIKPYVVGWLPAGPGASVAAELAERKTRPRGQWPPHGVKVEAVKGEITQVCMGFDELVRTGGLRHSGDPLLTAQVEQAERGRRGDAWVFTRPADGWVDALYAAAAAAHLARIIPPPLQVTRVVSVSRE